MCVYIYIYLYTIKCIYIYIYICIQTYIHTFLQRFGAQGALVQKHNFLTTTWYHQNGTCYKALGLTSSTVATRNVHRTTRYHLVRPKTIDFHCIFIDFDEFHRRHPAPDPNPTHGERGGGPSAPGPDTYMLVFSKRLLIMMG